MALVPAVLIGGVAALSLPYVMRDDADAFDTALTQAADDVHELLGQDRAVLDHWSHGARRISTANSRRSSPPASS